jgi:hypothetical protein
MMMMMIMMMIIIIRTRKKDATTEKLRPTHFLKFQYCLRPCGALLSFQTVLVESNGFLVHLSVLR